MNHVAEPTADIDLHAEIERLRTEVAALIVRAETAEALADHDVLTRALNRRGFMTVLNRSMAYCRRHEVEAALLYLDMDGFKGVNDGLGHAAGDAALMAVADLLLANVRESDAVGRLGGDEFALLLMNAGADDQGGDFGAQPFDLGVQITVCSRFGHFGQVRLRRRESRPTQALATHMILATLVAGATRVL